MTRKDTPYQQYKQGWNRFDTLVSLLRAAHSRGEEATWDVHTIQLENGGAVRVIRDGRTVRLDYKPLG